MRRVESLKNLVFQTETFLDTQPEGRKKKKKKE